MNTGAVLAAVVASEQRLLSVAAVYLATTYTLTVTDQLWEITQVMRNYNRVMGDAHDMVEILAVAPAVADRTETPFERGRGRWSSTTSRSPTRVPVRRRCSLASPWPSPRARRSGWSATRAAGRPR